MESWGVVKLLRALFGKWCFCIDYEDVGTGLSGITGKRVCITHTKQGPSLSDLLCFSASLLEIILQDNGSISTYLTGYFDPKSSFPEIESGGRWLWLPPSDLGESGVFKNWLCWVLCNRIYKIWMELEPFR